MRATWVELNCRPETITGEPTVGKAQTIHENEMALGHECTLQCAQKELDTADIVREAIFHHLRRFPEGGGGFDSLRLASIPPEVVTRGARRAIILVLWIGRESSQHKYATGIEWRGKSDFLTRFASRG